MNGETFEKPLREMENKDIDFKSELPEPEKVARLVVAFYNTRGGKIIFGVEDDIKKQVTMLSFRIKHSVHYV